MGIVILVRQHIYAASAPRLFNLEVIGNQSIAIFYGIYVSYLVNILALVIDRKEAIQLGGVENQS